MATLWLVERTERVPVAATAVYAAARSSLLNAPVDFRTDTVTIRLSPGPEDTFLLDPADVTWPAVRGDTITHVVYDDGVVEL